MDDIIQLSENSMKGGGINMKKAVVILLAVLVVAAFALDFKDVPKSHWAYPYIEKLVNAGIVTGYPDGTFKGKNAVSRYELAVLSGRLYDRVLSEIKPVKDDVTKIKSDISNLKMLVSGISSSLTEGLADTKKTVSELKKSVDSLNNSISYFYDQLDSVNNQLDTIRDAFFVLKGEVVSKDNFSAYQKKVDGTLSQYHDDIFMLKKRTSKLIERVSVLEFNSSKNSKAIPALQSDVESLKGKVEKLEAYKLETISNMALVKQNVSSLQKGYSKLYNNIKDLNSALDFQVKTLSKKISLVDSKVNTTISDLRSFKDSMVNMSLGLSNRVGKLETTVEGLKGNVDSVNEKLSSASKQIDTLKDSVSTLVSKLETVREDLESVKKTVNTNNEKIEEIAKKASGANTLAVIALVLAAVGIGIGVYAAVKP